MVYIQILTKNLVFINKSNQKLAHINYILYFCSQKKLYMANTTLRIKELCKRNGITQAQLANRLGIQAVSFSQAVARNKFSLDRLAEIADALGVEIVELFETEISDGKAVICCPHCGERISIDIKFETKSWTQL